MKMKHISSTITGRERTWHSNIIEVEKVRLEECKEGDLVYIEGNLLEDGTPTCVYGPHKVYNPIQRMLISRKGQKFYERSIVFRECTTE